MTEAEWLSCAAPQPMLAFLGDRASERKLRLFACALWLHNGYVRLGPQELGLVRLAERFASNQMPAEDMRGVLGPCLGVTAETGRRAAEEAIRAYEGRWQAWGPEGGWERQWATVREPACRLLREVFGNPFRPLPARSFPAHVLALAGAAAEEDPSLYPLLADALDDLGEEQAADHCRQAQHVKGCHVVDWILDRR
jgi:hypothetical protein